jgi:tRNA threonylcarbamoyladenosine biosynthesis protein TsaE
MSLLCSSAYDISTLSQLEAVAQELAASLQPGDVLALSGPLGVGKTTFTQALARALGVQMSVNSPTFVLIQRYTGGKIP